MLKVISGIKLPIAAGCYVNSGGIAARTFATGQALRDQHDCQVLIVGGGSGGCALAAKLSSKLGKNKVTVVEPAERHYYQPMFTLIGGGMKRLEQSYKPMAEVLPKNVNWIKSAAVEFDPKNNTVKTANGTNIKYDMLLVATGLQLNYDKIPGLVEALSITNGKVCSNYSPKYVDRTYECLQNIQGGNAIFTFPASPVKCPGAPQKIVYIAEHYFRKLNKRNKITVTYNTSLPVIFGVKHYADALWKVVEKRDIKVNLRRNLIEVRPQEDIAVFQDLDKPEQIFEEKYGLLHVTPPMSTPTFLAQCKELVNETAFVDVDKSTLQHLRYKNVFAIGDCSASPNSKTAASAAAQSPVVYHNMIAALKGKAMKRTYDGYASCPLVTGYRSCILAEFDYDLKPLETFPIAQNKERYSMFFLKKALMPTLYWKVMLNGYWNGPALMRNALSVFKFGKK
ncbi:sulfide:quinone oxidoreductase, mitochondrial [Bactrocera oleae]|uniref:sulfide:quinone oxidoreductase, mitochondrial n=1 Tax=Bactrocera oleae TaxID=104688 RepID=UPI00174B65EF|nr:sulfide:quinone oxidoreductase, mitochondrial [Bactrocera oleae]